MPSRSRSRAAKATSRRPRKSKESPALASRRQVERDRARAKIISAAIHLFAQRGIENVTFGSVARRARLSRPLVYFYFPDLRTLVLEAAYVAGTRLHERMVEAVKETPSGLDAIVALGRSYLAFHHEEPEHFYMCMVNTTGPQRNGKRPSVIEERILEVERAMIRLVEAEVARGVRDGSVRADVGDTVTVALSLWAFVQGLLQLSTGHRDTIERFWGLGLPKFLDAGFGTLRGALAASS